MKIKLNINESIVAQLVNWLYVDRQSEFFGESRILKLLNHASKPYVSVLCYALSIIIVLYQSILVGTIVDTYQVWFLLLIMSALFCDKRKLASSRANTYLVLFVVVAIISSLISAINGTPLAIIANGIYIVSIFPLYMIVASTYDKRIVKYLLVVIFVAVLPLLLAGLIQSFAGMATPAYWVSSQERLITIRIFGWSQNPNNLGALAMVISLAAMFLSWFYKKWYLFVYSILAGIVLILTFSRASWLGLMSAIITFVLIKNWRYIWLSFIGLTALLIPSIRQRLGVVFTGQFISDSIIDGRIWSFRSILDLFKSSPIIGIGPGAYGNNIARNYVSPVYGLLSQDGLVASFMVDMQWPQILCQTGLVGFLLTLSFFISYFVNAVRDFKQRGNIVSLASVSLLVSMFVVGCFENVWYFAPMAAIFGVFLGIGKGHLYESR